MTYLTSIVSEMRFMWSDIVKIALENVSNTTWVVFANKEIMNRMNIVSERLTFSTISSYISWNWIKMDKMLHSWKWVYFYELKDSESNEHSVKMSHFLKNFKLNNRNMVKMDKTIVNWKWVCFYESNDSESNEHSVKMTHFLENFKLNKGNCIKIDKMLLYWKWVYFYESKDSESNEHGLKMPNFLDFFI